MKITIPGKPIPLRRARINNKRFYDSQTKLKETYRILFKMKQNQPLSGPLSITCCFVFPYPKSQLKKMGETLSPRPIGSDIDNLLKLIFDCGNGILYHDDCQIVHVSALKLFGPVAKTMIELKPYEEHHDQKLST